MQFKKSVFSYHTSYGKLLWLFCNAFLSADAMEMRQAWCHIFGEKVIHVLWPLMQHKWHIQIFCIVYSNILLLRMLMSVKGYHSSFQTLCQFSTVFEVFILFYFKKQNEANIYIYTLYILYIYYIYTYIYIYIYIHIYINKRKIL